MPVAHDEIASVHLVDALADAATRTVSRLSRTFLGQISKQGDEAATSKASAGAIRRRRGEGCKERVFTALYGSMSKGQALQKKKKKKKKKEKKKKEKKRQRELSGLNSSAKEMQEGKEEEDRGSAIGKSSSLLPASNHAA
jgi:hypothetical protein